MFVYGATAYELARRLTPNPNRIAVSARGFVVVVRLAEK